MFIAPLYKPCFPSILLLCAFFGGTSHAVFGDEPRLLWEYEGRSHLYAPPLAAEMIADSPGLEILIADSEARRLRCLDARGVQRWECDGGWKKRLVSPPALSDADADGMRKIAVANGDGTLTIVRAADGAVLRQCAIGVVEWGGAVWAHLRDSGDPSIVTGTLENGVIACFSDGEPLWRFPGQTSLPAPNIRGFLAVCDVTGDGREEIFGLGRYGPFCLDPEGKLLWRHETGDEFPGAPIIADADRDGVPELYGLSRDDAYLCRFDALTGVPAWKAPLEGAPDGYSASSLAAGDITGDGKDEIVFGDARGQVYAFRHDGTLLWIHGCSKPLHSAVSLGDATGDGRVNVLAACGDHYLYCLDEQGRMQWRFRTERRLIAPATFTDLEGNGRTNLLLCGSDRRLRCLAANSRHVRRTMPWPAQRMNARRAGASFNPSLPQAAPIQRWESVLLFGDFEQGKVRDGLEQFDKNSPFYPLLMRRPRGWRAEGLASEAWGLSTEQVHSGKQSLFLDQPMTVSCEAQPCPSTLSALTVEAHAKGAGTPVAFLRWSGDYGTIREDALATASAEDGWTRHSLEEAHPPLGARRYALVLGAETEAVYWDSATALALHQEPPTAAVLVNQVGYDTGAPKRFVVQANFKAEAATFVLEDEDQRVRYEGVLSAPERIRGHFGNDWGYEYYTGDFSECNEPGRYRVRVLLTPIEEYSLPVEIGARTVWRHTAQPAYRFFYYQRCGMAIPGRQEACHLDDAVSPDGKRQYALQGGWHDAGDYNKYHNAPYLYGLAVAYGRRRADFDRLETAPSGCSGFLDEILWGGDHVRRMIMEDGSAFGPITSGYGFWGPPHLETDNLPGTGDERPGLQEQGANPEYHHAALARVALLLRGRASIDPWVASANKSLEYALRQGQRGWLQLSTALDLFAATDDAAFRALAETLFSEQQGGEDVSAHIIEITQRYDVVFGTRHADALRPAVLGKAGRMLACAKNPFGVYTFGPPENPNFFGASGGQGGWSVGTSSHLLEGATFMALAYQYDPDPRFLTFVYDQFNWTLGMNPFNISLMEGCGNAFAPSYHHRCVFAGVERGAVPGGVVNGITWRSVGDDRPSFDMSGVDIPDYESNEVWLPHNTNFLKALVELENAMKSSAVRD